MASRMASNSSPAFRHKNFLFMGKPAVPVSHGIGSLMMTGNSKGRVIPCNFHRNRQWFWETKNRAPCTPRRSFPLMESRISSFSSIHSNS